MEVLELKPVTKKQICAYIAKKSKDDFHDFEIPKLREFLKKKNIDFITVDFNVNMKEFRKSELAQSLDKLGIKYFQVDIPEYAMGYLYEEIVEKESLLNLLFEEYESMEDKDSYKGESLKNWIDMIREEIQVKEIFISLKLRPQWIVKKMLDLAKNYTKQQISFLHLVQEDICEDICTEVTEQLRALNVKVVQYVKKHNIINIEF
ncbi:MAG: hypothetical protein ACFFA6_03720 [Promethearchaeota archaeon]